MGKQATEEAVCLRKTVSEPDLPLGEAPSAKATQERVEAVPEPLFLAEVSACLAQTHFGSDGNFAVTE